VVAIVVATSAEGDEGCRRERLASADVAQDVGADETADHRAAPVERDVVGGGSFGIAHDLRKAEVVDEEAADGDFGSDVDEDADGGHEQVGLLPDAADGASRRVRLGGSRG
jgi:hypothetical protein